MALCVACPLPSPHASFLFSSAWLVWLKIKVILHSRWGSVRSKAPILLVKKLGTRTMRERILSPFLYSTVDSHPYVLYSTGTNHLQGSFSLSLLLSHMYSSPHEGNSRGVSGVGVGAHAGSRALLSLSLSQSLC